MNLGTNPKAFGLRKQGFVGRNFRLKAIAISFLALSSQLTFIESAEAATITYAQTVNCEPTRSGGGSVTMQVGDILVINTTGCLSGGFGSGGNSYGTWKSGVTTGQEVGTTEVAPGSGRVSFSDGHKVTFQASSVTPGATVGITFSQRSTDVDLSGSGPSPQILITVAAAVPAAPTLDSVTAGDRRVTVAFTAGANNGAAITHYEYSLNGGAYISAGTTTSPFTITAGISGRTSYSVTLKARNSVGLSSASNSISATTTDSAADASEAAAAEAARVAEAARIATANAAAAEAAKQQRELLGILSLIPELGKISVKVGVLTNSLLAPQKSSSAKQKCVKGSNTKFVKKGSKCPKGFTKAK